MSHSRTHVPTGNPRRSAMLETCLVGHAAPHRRTDSITVAPCAVRPSPVRSCGATSHARVRARPATVLSRDTRAVGVHSFLGVAFLARNLALIASASSVFIRLSSSSCTS